ncbi:hypothetical protein ACVWXB_004953 [Streptomyces sp. TE12347]
MISKSSPDCRKITPTEMAPLEVISCGQSAVADQGARDAGEGEEVFGLAFVAAVEAATASEL